jgi:hypothetical protein
MVVGKTRLTAVNFRKKTMIDERAHAGNAVLPRSSGHAGRVAADVEARLG